MDALAAIQARIPQFRGYATLDARREDDELIRSYVGEALAALEADRIGAVAGREAVLENLVIRAGFANQLAFRPFEYANLDDARLEAVEAADLALLEAADRLKAATGSDAGPIVDEIAAGFDARDALMRQAGGPSA